MIQNHLTSQPLSKRLKELKVPQVSEFYWQECADSTNNWSFGKTTTNYGLPVENYYSAFLSSELGELMPEQTICRRTFIETTQSWVWEVEVIGLKESTTKPIFSSSMAEAMGLMLEHLILNGLIKI